MRNWFPWSMLMITATTLGVIWWRGYNLPVAEPPDDSVNDMSCELENSTLTIYRCKYGDTVCFVMSGHGISCVWDGTDKEDPCGTKTPSIPF